MLHDKSSALQALHYASPAVVLASFMLSKVFATCLLHEHRSNTPNNSHRYLAAALLIGVSATLIGQATTYFAQSLSQPRWWATQDRVVYNLASIFAYGCMVIGLLENKKPVWYPYVVACSVALALEIPTAVLQGLTEPPEDSFAFSRLALHVVRALLVAFFCLATSWFSLQSRRPASKVTGEEREPLLGNGTNGHARTPDYKAVGSAESSSDDGDYDDGSDSDTESPAAMKELKQQQRKRLRETGSYIGYVKEFKVFAPLLWPSRNRFVQACLAVIGLVIIVDRFLNVLVPRQLGIITDALTSRAGSGTFPWQPMAIWMLLTWLNSSAGTGVLKSLADIQVDQFAYRSLGTASFAHVMGLSMDFHCDKNSGELIRAISQGQNLTGLLDFMCFRVGPMFIDLFVAVFYVAHLFDIYMTLILVVVCMAYVWVGAKTTAWSLKSRRRFNDAMRDEGRVQNEAINNWQTVSHFNRGKYECDRYADSLDTYCTAERQFQYVHYFGSSTQALVMILGRLAAIFLAVYRVSQGTVPVGNFVVLISYWRTCEAPMMQLSWSVRRLSSMLTDAERLLQLFQTQPTVKDKENASPIDVKAGHVEFRDVGFSYDPRRQTIKNVSFQAKPGQTVALVGETGGGKSSILKLLYRYYDIASGNIRIDGQDIRDVTLDSLRESFGMVPQDPSLFNISIMENVRYARLDATDEDVREACRAAAIHDKIETFPDQYASKVGERGVKLSGGELQRVSIARAILRRPHIVLLDEATSMVDAETESLIQKALRRLTADRTTFIIAHRLSTVQHSDLILVVHEGEIVERGTHEELFHQRGKYFALWSKQFNKDQSGMGGTLRVDGEDEALIGLEEEGQSKDGLRQRAGKSG